MGKSQDGGKQKTKCGKFSEKMNITYPMIRTCPCTYQGVKNFCFSENLVCCFFVTSVLRFTLLPYYKRNYVFVMKHKVIHNNLRFRNAFLLARLFQGKAYIRNNKNAFKIIDLVISFTLREAYHKSQF